MPVERNVPLIPNATSPIPKAAAPEIPPISAAFPQPLKKPSPFMLLFMPFVIMPIKAPISIDPKISPLTSVPFSGLLNPYPNRLKF